MRERITGPVIVSVILIGVLLILGLNLDLKGRPDSNSSSTLGAAELQPTTVGYDPSQDLLSPANTVKATSAAQSEKAVLAAEHPIGDQIERNQMRIAAVWLPSEPMAGMPPHRASAELVHIEADIKATEGNRNGFALDEKIPYILVNYTITPLTTPKPGQLLTAMSGTMIPMVARDGFHYGATIEMPGPGQYKLTYQIEPPSMGRHTDVDPWWKPFELSFTWDYPGRPAE